jgi:hypothetical protein
MPALNFSKSVSIFTAVNSSAQECVTVLLQNFHREMTEAVNKTIIINFDLPDL